MTKIFLDTNILLDLFIREDFRLETEAFLITGRHLNCKFFISYLSVANFAYILRKLPVQQLNSLLMKMCDIFIVADSNVSQIRAAIELNAKDFEDALQYQCAHDNGCDCIVSRNAKDFKFSKIPIFTASQCNSLLLEQKS